MVRCNATMRAGYNDLLPADPVRMAHARCLGPIASGACLVATRYSCFGTERELGARLYVGMASGPRRRGRSHYDGCVRNSICYGS